MFRPRWVLAALFTLAAAAACNRAERTVDQKPTVPPQQRASVAATTPPPSNPATPTPTTPAPTTPAPPAPVAAPAVPVAAPTPEPQPPAAAESAPPTAPPAPALSAEETARLRLLVLSVQIGCLGHLVPDWQVLNSTLEKLHTLAKLPKADYSALLQVNMSNREFALAMDGGRATCPGGPKAGPAPAGPDASNSHTGLIASLVALTCPPTATVAKPAPPGAGAFERAAELLAKDPNFTRELMKATTACLQVEVPAAAPALPPTTPPEAPKAP